MKALYFKILKHVLTFIVKKLVNSETRAISFVIITTKSSFNCPARSLPKILVDLF